MASPSPPSTASPRVRLARAALDAALGVDGVVRAEGGPGALRSTWDGTERLRGVVVTSEGDGRYAVDLHLVVRLVPLPRLGERVRERVARAARFAGMADSLGTVRVRFEDLAEDDELTEEDGA